ncbi:SEC-C metal-binding domain-containing protein [Vibrio cholerae]|uniref:SEC-C metal-binding domain-containing protein n=1 Tax=Vibrio cholerae TaxID=666 RepID=UPI00155DE6AC|nr:SEC-C metal-binding domain-containing protein [Vibrio cholerae]NOE32012.1 hypothetical protein [Vibrio cholerae]
MEVYKELGIKAAARIVYPMPKRPEELIEALEGKGFVCTEKSLNIRPKQKCPCGSKKRFKKCCGKGLTSN